MCSEEEELRLQLVIKSQYEQDKKKVDGMLFSYDILFLQVLYLDVCTRIKCDLQSFETSDAPIYDVSFVRYKYTSIFQSYFSLINMR